MDIERGAVVTKGGAGASGGHRQLPHARRRRHHQARQEHRRADQRHLRHQRHRLVARCLRPARRNGSFGIAGAISQREPDNFKNGERHRVPFTRQDLMSGLFKMDYIKPTEQILKISFGGVLYDNDFSANSYFQNIKADTLTAGYVYQPRNNPPDRFQGQRVCDLDGADLPPRPQLFATAVGRRIEDDGFGFDVSNTSRFRMGPFGVAMDYGGEYFENVSEDGAGRGELGRQEQHRRRFLADDADVRHIRSDRWPALRYLRSRVTGPCTGRTIPRWRHRCPWVRSSIDQVRGSAQPEGDAGRTASAVAAALCDLLGVHPCADHQRDDVPAAVHPGARSRQSLFPNPLLDPGSPEGLGIRRQHHGRIACSPATTPSA